MSMLTCFQACEDKPGTAGGQVGSRGCADARTLPRNLTQCSVKRGVVFLNQNKSAFLTIIQTIKLIAKAENLDQIARESECHDKVAKMEIKFSGKSLGFYE